MTKKKDKTPAAKQNDRVSNMVDQMVINTKYQQQQKRD